MQNHFHRRREVERSEQRVACHRCWFRLHLPPPPWLFNYCYYRNHCYFTISWGGCRQICGASSLSTTLCVLLLSDHAGRIFAPALPYWQARPRPVSSHVFRSSLGARTWSIAHSSYKLSHQTNPWFLKLRISALEWVVASSHCWEIQQWIIITTETAVPTTFINYVLMNPPMFLFYGLSLYVGKFIVQHRHLVYKEIGINSCI